jgi:hypothetical protein
MGFFSFLVLLGIAYLLWRVTDQLPDLIFRLSEVQRDVAELRRSLADRTDDATSSAPAATPPAAAPESASAPESSSSPAGGDTAS